MRYYFDIFDGDHWTRDDFGIECETETRARHQAVLALTEMAREYLPNDGPGMDLSINVRSRHGQVFTARLDFGIQPGPALQNPSGLVASPHR